MASFNFKSIFKKINKKNNSLNNQESDFLNNFGLAEFGSALDMLAAAELTTTNKLKKGYLNHAIDEFRHAQLFFNHAKNLMNNSIINVNGDLMIISQFTLFAKTKKGNRPSYINAAKSPKANKYYNSFCEEIESILSKKVTRGVFGCLLYTSPSPRDRTRSRMPSSA